LVRKLRDMMLPCRLLEGDDILERIVVPQDRVSLGGGALPHTVQALLGAGVHLTNVGTRLIARSRDGTIQAKEPAPATAFPVHAQTLPVAIVRTSRQITVWTNLGLVGADRLAAIHPLEPHIAHALPVQTEPIPVAIARATPHLGVKCCVAAVPSAPASVAEALPWGVSGDEGALAVTTTPVGALRVLAIRPRPTLLADTCP